MDRSVTWFRGMFAEEWHVLNAETILGGKLLYVESYCGHARPKDSAKVQMGYTPPKKKQCGQCLRVYKREQHNA